MGQPKKRKDETNEALHNEGFGRRKGCMRANEANEYKVMSIKPKGKENEYRMRVESTSNSTAIASRGRDKARLDFVPSSQNSLHPVLVLLGFFISQVVGRGGGQNGG